MKPSHPEHFFPTAAPAPAPSVPKRMSDLPSKGSDIDRLLFTTIEFLVGSSEGTYGVLFAATPTGTFVLKCLPPHYDTSSEVFATFLADKLSFRVPQMRVVWSKGRTGSILAAKLIELLPTHPHCRNFIERYTKPSTNNPLMVMEFISGVSSREYDWYHMQRFNPQKFKKSLEFIGRMLAFDILINNSDRYPCEVWQVLTGNPDNLLVTALQITVAPEKEVGEFVLIDQAINVIRDESFMTRYLERVESLLDLVGADNELKYCRVGAHVNLGGHNLQLPDLRVIQKAFVCQVIKIGLMDDAIFALWQRMANINAVYDRDSGRKEALAATGEEMREKVLTFICRIKALYRKFALQLLADGRHCHIHALPSITYFDTTL